MFLPAGSPVLALVCVLVFLIASISAPIAGYKLLKGLEIDAPGRTALFMYLPLFSLLTLVGMRSFNRQWSRHYGVEAGILGPTRQALERLQPANRSPTGSPDASL